MRKRTLIPAALLAATLFYALHARRHPAACPYRYRLAVSLPRPFLTRNRLRRALSPSPGERILEVGPGTGYYALHTARWISPDGTLHVLDLQQKMLDHTTRRAAAKNIHNITPTRGDAQSLPYPDHSFDAAYLVATLGEIPDQDRALRELHRVLKPGGRLVVGELLPDPHMVPLRTLLSRAEAAGLRYEDRLGPRTGYYARFVTPEND
ncbi:2-methoxy-6-polyprenyl-1,4-benzoquinol methylase, mitochondrial [Rubrobacter xylanophilus DSM 9941]|uniref:class I SAM-dependent methyltransferase n=1 Tax=Rubrobacter xylanophilus TaxID=49319 RepID=UPI001C63DF25|nr:methyltransferase domain-containing protein [Rubrobacter xylanophilus]QYJ16799.1 2-methoxy-6-polyprenyl-1,4-benzoquinol methylase, mitochondrial [Rubrobacter xylanophilus DSM 9941]